MDGELSNRSVVILSVIVVVALVAGAGLLIATQPDPVKITVNPPLPTATPPPSATPAPILVYVTGAVANPQTTLELPAGSRVQNALDAAGGVTDSADLERVNVAGILRDGDHVHVFAIGESASALVPTPGGGGLVYVNTATLEELTTLPGIGPAIAQRIIDYREANGPFVDLNALDAVSGIGAAMLDAIKDLVSFEE